MIDLLIQVARQDNLISLRGLFDLGLPRNLRRKLQQQGDQQKQTGHRRQG